MEDERVTITNKHGNKKIHHQISSSLSNGGEGGIAGLLLFGGALAVAGFMAVASFASNKDKAKGTYDHKPKSKPKPQQLLLDDGCKREDDHETTQSLRSLLQGSTTQDGDAPCWTSNININQISSSELLSTQMLILEEKIDLKPNREEESPTCFHHQEIVFSDDSHPESGASSNENGGEECLVSLFDSRSSQAQELDKDEPQDGLKSIETETEDDDIDEDDVDEESDNVLESGEEDSSKATGSTSLDSNEEPVWPAELIEEQPVQEFKEGVINIQSEAQETAKTNISAPADYCDSHVCSDGDADDSDNAGNDGAMTVTAETTLNKKANFSLVLTDQPSVLSAWVIPMLFLALLLLLVLLTHRPQESFNVLDDGSNTIIVP